MKVLKFYYYLHDEDLSTDFLQGLQSLNQDTSRCKAEVFNGLILLDKA